MLRSLWWLACALLVANCGRSTRSDLTTLIHETNKSFRAEHSLYTLLPGQTISVCRDRDVDEGIEQHIANAILYWMRVGGRDNRLKVQPGCQGDRVIKLVKAPADSTFYGKTMPLKGNVHTIQVADHWAGHWTANHEMGHVFGFDHISDGTKSIMNSDDNGKHMNKGYLTDYDLHEVQRILSLPEFSAAESAWSKDQPRRPGQWHPGDPSEPYLGSMFPPQASRGHGGPAGGPIKQQVAGVQFKYWTPPQQVLDRNPTQVFMYLHGDTAGDYHSESFKRTKNEALRRGLIFVAVLAPDGSSWWRSDKDAVIRGVSGVFEYLFQNYNIYTNRNLMQGVSGGSTGQTMYLFPGGIGRYVVASFLHCGGAPGGSLPRWQPNEDERRKLQFFINYGDQDFLANSSGSYGNVIGGTIKSLSQKNMWIKPTVIPGKGHCKFDHTPYVLQELDKLVLRH